MAVRVEGLRELNAALGKTNRKLQRELQARVRKIAEPVAEDIRSRATAKGFSQQSVSGIRAGSRHGGALVRQSRRRKTGQRRDFGGIQMRGAFIPGLEANEKKVLKDMERFVDDCLGFLK